MQHVDMKGVALDPFAAIEQPAKLAQGACDLNAQGLLHRVNRTHLVGYRADAANPGGDVRRLGEGATAQERFEEPGRLEDAQFSALDNVAAGPEFAGVPRALARQRAEEWLVRVGLAGHGQKYPHQMSGGMKKRAQLAQTLVIDPPILLMDEPFSALDVQTRQLMENELLALWQGSRKSVLFITHDLEEAISLSDRVVILSAGPATRPIAEFTIDLPRPRDVAEIRMTPHFLQLQERIWAVMREEVLKAYKRGAAA